MKHLVVLAALAIAAGASRHEWVDPYAHSWIELRETQEPGAVAEVHFVNEPSHQGNDDFTLTLDGLTVTVSMEWNVGGIGAERITVTPPDGYFAWPEAIEVNERQQGTIYIYSNEMEVS